MKPRRSKWHLAAGLAGFCLLATLAASAVAPAADRTDGAFGQGGVSEVLAPPESEGFAVTIRDLARTTDGDLVAAIGESEDLGYFAAARFTRSGFLDPGFGTDGFSLGINGVPRAGGKQHDIEIQAEAVAVQPDGKILVAGYQQSPGSIRFQQTAPLLARYRPNGQLDRGFGQGGTVAPRPPFKPELPGGPLFGGTVLHEVAIAPGGRIVAVGARNESFPRPAALVIAYRPDGSIDRGFGRDGRVLLEPRRQGIVNYTNTGLFAVRVLAGGKILVAGYRNGRLLLARLRSNGALDPSFGDGDGKVVRGVGTSGCCPGGASLAVQPDGRIVVQANRFSRNAQRAVLLRFHPNGQLDRSFGDGGVAAPGPPSYLKDANDIALQPDGKIVAVGSAAVSRSREVPFAFAAVRYRPNGQLDRSFGRGGLQTLARGVRSIALAAVPGAGGRVVAAGGFTTDSLEEGGEARLLLTRFLP